jgi:hypothetical protein
MSEFIWTDALVSELFELMTSLENPEVRKRAIDKFKASKQPKPEWEIVSFESGGRVWHRRHNEFDGVVFENNGQCFAEGWGLNPETDAKIRSVKRLSDGEVFTVGDTIGNKKWGGFHTITNFVIFDEKKLVAFDGDLGWNLRDIPASEKESPISVLLTPSQIEKLKNLLQ